MRKIQLASDVPIMGFITLRAGQQFFVEEFNTRFIYIKINNCRVQLPRKICTKIY